VLRYFIKVGARDKLLQKAKDGGGFQTVEVMVTSNYELAVTEPERPFWTELFPAWDCAALKLNGFEGGVLLGTLLQLPDDYRKPLTRVIEALVTMKQMAEEAAGVTKELLPGGNIQLTDRDGRVFTRPVLPHEVKRN